MTAFEMYTRFIRNGRKTLEHTYEYKMSLQSVRNSLYRIRKQKNEAFMITTRDLTLTIYDTEA